MLTNILHVNANGEAAEAMERVLVVHMTGHMTNCVRSYTSRKVIRLPHIMTATSLSVSPPPFLSRLSSSNEPEVVYMAALLPIVSVQQPSEVDQVET